MKIRIGKYGRKAISPIIATVLIIAVTLIAAVAIGGFVFGIFGSSSNSAQVQVTGIALVANTESSAGTDAVSCVTYAAGNSLTLTNTGTAATTVTGVSITFGGAVYTYTVTGCTVTPAGKAGVNGAGNPLNLVLTGDSITTATSGASYTGTVTMGNGAILIFAGTFI
jgi:flagellin-like protein